jgi:hypothetical protein
MIGRLDRAFARFLEPDADCRVAAEGVKKLRLKLNTVLRSGPAEWGKKNPETFPIGHTPLAA